MGKEASLTWAPLQKELIKLNWHYQRLEDKLALGVPDLNIHIPNGPDVWLELKYANCPKDPTLGSIEIGLRREQYIWLRNARRAGRICYLLARAGSSWHLWGQQEDWEAAKHPCPWFAIKRNSRMYLSPADLLKAIPTLPFYR